MAKATYLLRKAGELVKQKNYQDAVEVYLRATETDPSDARAWFGLGVCLYKVGNLDVAHIALERADKMGYPRARDALERVESAEERRSAEGKGARRTAAPSEAQERAKREAAAAKPPPRQRVRPREERIDLGRSLRVMLVENIESDRQAITEAVEGTIRRATVSSAEYGVSTSDTMSGTVGFDAAILDWDTDPDAAAGLIHILKIKRPVLFVICLTEKWDPESAAEIMEAGANYHVVKEDYFTVALPLVLAQWARRDEAVVQASQEQRGVGPPWDESLDALAEPVLVVGADLKVKKANRAAENRFVGEGTEIVGQPYSRLLYDQDDAPASCPVLHALEMGESASGRLETAEGNGEAGLQVWPIRREGQGVVSAIAVVRADAAAAQETLYRELAEKANAGTAIVDPEGRFAFVNERLCNLLGLTENELMDEPAQDMLPDEQRWQLLELFDAAREEGKSDRRLPVQRSDGRVLSLQLRASSMETPEGTSVVLIAVPAGEAQAGPAEMEQLAGVLEEGVEELRCGVVVLDEQGSVTWLNSAGAELLGGQKGELLDHDYLRLVRERLQDRLRNGRELADALTAAHESGESVRDFALRAGPGADGFTYSSTALRDAPGLSRIEHFYPARQMMPLELGTAEGEESLAAVAAMIPEMLFGADPDGTITRCSPAAAEVTGYEQQQLQGMPLADLTAEDSRARVEELIAAVRQQPDRVQKELLLMERRSGQRYWAELSLMPLTADQGGELTGLHGALRDATEQKMAQAIREIINGQRPL